MTDELIERAAQAMRKAYNRHLAHGSAVPWEAADPDARESVDDLRASGGQGLQDGG